VYETPQSTFIIIHRVYWYIYHYVHYFKYNSAYLNNIILYTSIVANACNMHYLTIRLIIKW
jgi:hypothetical protein